MLDGSKKYLHGLGALLQIAHPANGFRLLDQLAVTPMNHLVVCLPPAAIFCELVAWRKTLLLISGLAVLTRDSGFKQNCTHTVRGCSLNYRWTCYKRNCQLHWINTWILVDLAPRLVHPLCCSLRAIMQKTPPPSVSILHSHAERLKPARHSGGHQSGPPSDSQSRNLHIATSTSQSADLLKACPRHTTMFGTLVSQRLSPNLAHLYNFSV